MPIGANPQSSFIPHEADFAGRKRASPAGIVDFAALISIVLFVASGALAVGVFLYQGYLETSKTSKADQLERAKAAFEPSLITQLTRLDDRMSSATKILNSHPAASAFFHTLEKTTITTLGFSSLSFDVVDPSSMTVKMNGVARSVNSVALQADLFGKGGVFKNPIFSNIDRQKDGVHFMVSGAINPTSLNYVQIIEGGMPQQLLPKVSGTTTPAADLRSPFGTPIPSGQQAPPPSSGQ